MANIPFSTELETWLRSKKTKTVGDMQIAFGEKSFAILFLFCCLIPSLPLPTGGLDYVLLPIVMIAALQMVFGRRNLWLPERFTRVGLGDSVLNKILPFVVKRIRWFEKFSRPRFADFLTTPIFRTSAGLFVFVFAFAALIAPPFSGLDTLPALGAVIISLAIILEDITLFFAGLVIGAVGVSLVIAAAGAISALLQYVL